MLQQYYLNVLGSLVKLLVCLVDTKSRRVFGTLIIPFDSITSIHIGGSIHLKTNNKLRLGPEFSLQYVFNDVDAPKIPEESSPHLRLRKSKQLQGVHEIELTVEFSLKTIFQMGNLN